MTIDIARIHICRGLLKLRRKVTNSAKWGRKVPVRTKNAQRGDGKIYLCSVIQQNQQTTNAVEFGYSDIFIT